MQRKLSMKKTWIFGQGFALLIAGLLTATVVTANDWYVKPGGDDGAAGDSWDTAWASPQHAFNQAGEDDTIHLAGGEYADAPLGSTYPSNSVFLIQNATNLTVIGGYEALSGQTPGEPDPEQWETILRRSSGTARILTVFGSSNCVVRNVTIRDANANAAVRIDQSQDVTLDGCRITENQVEFQAGGIGVYQSGGVLMTNCWVAENRVRIYRGTGRGAGAYVGPGSHLTVRNSFFMGV